MKTIIGCSLILFLALIVAPVNADDWQDAKEAYKSKDYKTAFDMFKRLVIFTFVCLDFAVQHCFHIKEVLNPNHRHFYNPARYSR